MFLPLVSMSNICLSRYCDNGSKFAISASCAIKAFSIPSNSFSNFAICVVKLSPELDIDLLRSS